MDNKREESRIVSVDTAWRGKHVRVEITRFRNRQGRIQPYETVRRNTEGDIVSVIAFTPDRNIVLVSSYRTPRDARVIEKPAGLCDRKGEAPEDLAARELLEETGYGGGTPMELVLRGPFNAGLSDCVMSVFFTNNVQKLQDQELEEGEDIEVMLVPVDEVVGLMAQPPDGHEVDIKLLAGFPVLQARGYL